MHAFGRLWVFSTSPFYITPEMLYRAQVRGLRLPFFRVLIFLKTSQFFMVPDLCFELLSCGKITWCLFSKLGLFSASSKVKRKTSIKNTYWLILSPFGRHQFSCLQPPNLTVSSIDSGPPSSSVHILKCIQYYRCRFYYLLPHQNKSLLSSLQQSKFCALLPISTELSCEMGLNLGFFYFFLSF